MHEGEKSSWLQLGVLGYLMFLYGKKLHHNAAELFYFCSYVFVCL